MPREWLSSILKMTAKHKNIPFFIPHEGCGFKCIFCSQTKITGVCRTAEQIADECDELRKTIESSIATLGSNTAEIAFFGGSFTGIEPERMIRLLAVANEYIGGNITGIRLSTRPDYIDANICRILKEYGVTAVELGIQSVSDKVLAACRRGHTSDVSEKACYLIKENGFLLTGQMMCGLPESTASDEAATAQAIVSWGCDSTRIYPTVVFEGTELYRMTQSGGYIPLTVDEAVVRAADCAVIFIKNGVDILRIGLHSSENLDDAPYGAVHPALGELVMSEIYYRLIRPSVLHEDGAGFTVYVPQGDLSKAIGQHRKNVLRLEAETGKRLKFCEDASLDEYKIRIERN